MRNPQTLFLVIIVPFFAFSQAAFKVKGKLIDNISRAPIPGVIVRIDGIDLQQQTKADGVFSFANILAGNYTLHLESPRYISFELPIVVDRDLDMDLIPMEKDIIREQNDNIIMLTENELDDDEGSVETVSGLLQASRDVFSNIAAFEFGQTFFRPRGLGAEDGMILINGIPMNKFFDGRPQWSNWGGLNDAVRNQEFTPYSAPSAYSFGGLSGTTNISTKASAYRSGYRLSASSTNRNYNGRLMATYNSGLQKDKFAYSISASRRWAAEGANEGTLYDAWSVFSAFEYRPQQDHILNFTAIYAFNRRGRSSANTEEVSDLKGIRYNSYWGYQDGKIRNSRIRRLQEPIFMLSHYWKISDDSKLNINLAYQSGKTGNSRLDFGGVTAMTNSSGELYYSGGASNPDPVYYQKLPGFLLSGDEINYEEVHNRRKAFIQNGQLNWDALYAANINNADHGRNAAYVWYEDRVDDTQLSANAIFNTALSGNISLDAAVNYRNLRSQNFANVLDLLGGSGYLDVDNFADTPARAPNDLRNPDRIVREGDRFKYNYNMYASDINGFVQTRFEANKTELYLGVTLGSTTYQREGLYQNGAFPDNSSGKSEKPGFMNLGAKTGLSYKINGKHFINLNASYIQKTPALRNTFSNVRQNNDVVKHITPQRSQAVDVSYIVRSHRIKSRLTAYYQRIADASEVSFFFVNGLQGDMSSFVQQALTGIEKRKIGLEFGIAAQLTPTIKLKGAAAIGEFIYSNDPALQLTSDDLEEDFPMLEARLKNYKLSGGPQRAFSAGFEYRDPGFWWFGASVNYFSNAYIAINPLRRTSNFYSDAYGLPFDEYDENIAKTLLHQEKLDDYYLLNLMGGKSWSIKRKYYIGFFASISNALNQQYKTGGFEQARNGNYRKLLEDSQNEIPVFGSKYWYGQGTGYFINVYLSF